jgi:predicted aspartyl protease
MPRIELSIDAKYLEGSWGAFEGVRELVQNGKDAEVEHNAPLEITHYAKGGQLRIENQGVTLGYEALLMGHTSKADRQDLIGKWGEGLKVGTLALLRDGYQVKIRTGSEVWVPAIERSEKFQADVLVFDIRTGRKHQDRVRVEVSPIDSGDWKRWKRLFLFVKRPPKDQVIDTGYHGELLLEPERAGVIYVKGIATERRTDFRYGYNLKHVEIDRDRRMVKKEEVDYFVAAIWNSAVTAKPGLATQLSELLADRSPEIDGMLWYANKNVQEGVAKEFKKEHGDKALPAATMADNAKLEHYGRKGVVVPRVMQKVLEGFFGTTEKNLDELKKAAQKRYSWHELTDTEQEHLQWALGTIYPACEEVSLDLLEIVDFTDEEAIEGQWDPDTRRILLAKSLLTSPVDTLRVLIHEAAHMNGDGDGEKSHVRAIELLWAAIFKQATCP